MHLNPEDLNLTATLPGLRVTGTPSETYPGAVTVTVAFPDPTLPVITATARYNRHGAVIFDRSFQLGEPGGAELLTRDEQGPRQSTHVAIWNGQAHARTRYHKPQFQQEVRLNGRQANLPLVFNLDWYDRWALAHLGALLVPSQCGARLDPDQISQILQQLPRDQQVTPRQHSDRARVQAALHHLGTQHLTVEAFAHWFAALPVPDDTSLEASA